MVDAGIEFVTRVDARWAFDSAELRRLERQWRKAMRCAALEWRRLMKRRHYRKAEVYLADAKNWREGAHCWGRQARRAELQGTTASAADFLRDYEDDAKQYQPV